MSVEGKVAVVTGASRGIGRAIALKLADQGFKVACVATSFSNAESTSQEIEGMGGDARAYGMDVSDPDVVKSVFDQIEKEMGAIAVLVNNAGVTRDGLFMRMSDEDWQKPISVNLTGAFYCSRAVVRGMMKARWGRIINLTSVIGLHGGSGQANYSASKAGLVGLTMSLAKEFGSRGITVNAVAPGFIDTDMTAELPAEFKEKMIRESPAGRLGTPDDIAEVVGFLASEGSAFVTGQTITVDGGLTL